MLTTKTGLFLFAVCAAACCAAVASQGPTNTPTREQYFAFNEIHVDQDCRILPDPAHVPPGKKAKPYADSAVCHLDHIFESQHLEERISGNELLRSKVEIHEREFVLQDISEDPVTFVVEQRVPANWAVDSDPQPKQMIGQTALFPVIVQPGEIVRLHVGMRHETALHPRPIAAHSGPRAHAHPQQADAKRVSRRADGSATRES
jgi:hypothetical protein